LQKITSLKYTLLSKEQLESLHQEFAVFLASQSIDKIEWDRIKKENPKLVDQEIELFSDMVWEKVLDRVSYLEHFTPNHIFLIQTQKEKFYSIIISTNQKNINFCNKEGLDWLEQNWNSNEIIFKTGQKTIEQDPNQEIFELIKKGATITSGELYQKINLILNP
jgi:hypothetical protein